MTVPMAPFNPGGSMQGEGHLRTREAGSRGFWLLRHAGSLRFTLVLLALLLAGVLLYYVHAPRHSWLIVMPLLLLSANLLAAIVIHPTFRRQAPLLTFHLALLAVLLLVAIGRLSHLDGRVEVASGERFAAASAVVEAGPLHRWRLDQADFLLDDFSIAYQPGPSRGATRATVAWRDADGALHQGMVGDHHPLVLDGYRFYTTHNKGFAPVFTWQPDGGMPQQGIIHFPAYPTHQYGQMQEWNVPGSTMALRAELRFDEVIIDPEHPSTFHAPHQHTLVLRHGSVSHELHPGETVALPGGRLTYQELRTWMGFKISSDWTLSWLLAAGCAATLALGWHFWRKFAQRPWLETETAATSGEDRAA